MPIREKGFEVHQGIGLVAAIYSNDILKSLERVRASYFQLIYESQLFYYMCKCVEIVILQCPIRLQNIVVLQ
jgi:hypothetical protein